MPRGHHDLISLSEVAGADPELIGGKARGFAVLREAGLPVPEGFVLTTTVHQAALADSGRIPGPVAEEVARRVGEMGGVPLAVRSSASGEDGGDHSHAGQYLTRLGVRGARRGPRRRARMLGLGRRRARRRLPGPPRAGRRRPDGGDRAAARARGVRRRVHELRPRHRRPRDDRRQRLLGPGRARRERPRHPGRLPPGPRRRRPRVLRGRRQGRDARDGPRAVRSRSRCPSTAAWSACSTTPTSPSSTTASCAASGVLGRPADCEFSIVDDRVVWLQCRPMTALPSRPTTREHTLE